MVSISRAAPAASKIWSVAFMISGPMPSPWATVIGVFLDIREQPAYWNAPHRATGLRSLLLQRRPLQSRGLGESSLLPADVEERGRLETRRALARHLEGAFESHTGTYQGALVEEPANQCDAVWNAARRREFRQGVGRVWRPIAARLAHMYEACVKGERRMSGEIADREHFVAQGRHQEKLHLGKDARHLKCAGAAQPVGLDEIH